MNDEDLTRTLVTYWTIAQTLATKSRFWLEDAVAEIITGQVRLFGRRATHVAGRLQHVRYCHWKRTFDVRRDPTGEGGRRWFEIPGSVRGAPPKRPLLFHLVPVDFDEVRMF